MAEKRMFAKAVIDSDMFLDMPLTAQALYFHMAMRADDDGFVDNPKKIQRMVGASDDDFRLLIAKRFVIVFESGIIVISHWKLHNYIRSDRYKPTIHKAEKARISTDESRVYTAGIPCGIPNDNQRLTQYRLDKISIDKSNIDKGESVRGGKEAKPPSPPKPSRHKYGVYKNVLLSDEDMEKLKAEFTADWQERIDRLSEYMESTGKTYKNHLATIRAWSRRDQGEKAGTKPEKKWSGTDDPPPDEILGI